jgi:hypothetical protein
MLSLDLPARRRVLKQFTPTPIRPFLYKYFPPNIGHSMQNLHAVIVGSVLRMNPPSEFNDPFEMQAHIVMVGSEEERLARFESVVREQDPLLGWRAVQARVQSFMVGTEESFAPTWRQSLTNERESAGVFCFAGNAKNTLMWSHYASDHKGVCLQFERVQDIATFSHALRVHYVPVLPVLNYIKDFERGIGRMLFSKHPCWGYEQESRIFLRGQARRYLPFAPQALRKLIFGCRAQPAFVETIASMLAHRAAVGHPPIDVYFARRHPKMYRLIVQRGTAN